MKNKTVRQFATDLEVHPNTVYQWVRNGKLPCSKMGGVIRIRPCHEEEFFKRCEFDASLNCYDEEMFETPRRLSSGDAYELGVSI